MEGENRGYDYDQSSLSDMGYQKQEFDADSGELVSADEDEDVDGDFDDDFTLDIDSDSYDE